MEGERLMAWADPWVRGQQKSGLAPLASEGSLLHTQFWDQLQLTISKTVGALIGMSLSSPLM